MIRATPAIPGLSTPPGFRKVAGQWVPMQMELSRRRAGLGGRNFASGRASVVSTRPAGVSYLDITTQPSSSATTDVAFSVQPVIQLRLPNGDPHAVADVTVTASKASGSGTLGGTATATTNASGVATFTNLEIVGDGAHTLNFAATGYTSVVSGTVTVGAADAMSYPGDPGAWTVAGGVTQLIWDDFDPAYYTGAIGAANGVGVKAREDGGNPWALRGTAGSTLFHETSDLDPWFGLGKLRCDYTHDGSSQANRMVDHPAASAFAASAAGLDSIIWQVAWKEAGTCTKSFLGKNIDQLKFIGGSNHRVTAEMFSNTRVGNVAPANCDADMTICNVLYSSNGASARFPAEDPPSAAAAWTDVCYSDYGSPGGSDGYTWWKTTMNHSIDPPGTNGINFMDNTWRLDTWRWTRSAEAGSDHGRLELWRKSVAHGTYKLMEFIGDVGERFAGDVATWPSDQSWSMDACRGPFGYSQAFWLTDGSLDVHLGGYSVVGHARLAL
jgi:hypothetical protein